MRQAVDDMHIIDYKFQRGLVLKRIKTMEKYCEEGKL